MSTATAESLSPVEYVRRLPAGDKAAVLTAIMRDAIRDSGGNALIPVADADGKSMGYYVPPAVADRHSQALAPVLDEARRQAVARAVATPNDTFEMDTFLDGLSRKDQG